jgi:hypothetical protein
MVLLLIVVQGVFGLVLVAEEVDAANSSIDRMRMISIFDFANTL